jgi:hypothetical protein
MQRYATPWDRESTSEGAEGFPAWVRSDRLAEAGRFLVMVNRKGTSK